MHDPRTQAAGAADGAAEEVAEDLGRVHAFGRKVPETAVSVVEVVGVAQDVAHPDRSRLLPTTGVVEARELPRLGEFHDDVLKGTRPHHLSIEVDQEAAVELPI